MGTMEERRTPPRAALWAVASVAVLFHAWCLALPFQADDYILLRQSPSAIGLAASPPPLPGVSTDLLDNTYLFRPVTWFLWWLLTLVGGGIASAPLFHAVSILIKAFSATLVLRILSRAGAGRTAACAGAVLFAASPGSSQSTTWISAQGDQLAVVFMAWAVLIAQDVARREPTIADALRFAAAVALATASKDVALATLPAVALAWFAAAPAPRRIPWRMVVAGAMGVVAVLAARGIYLGTLSPRYLSPVALEISDVVKIPRLFGHWICYWNSSPTFADLAPRIVRPWIAAGLDAETVRRGLLGVAPLLVVVPVLVFAPRRLRLHVAMAGCLSAALAPPLLVYFESGAHSISRVYEPAAAIAAVWVGLAATGVSTRRVVVALLPLALVTVDFAIHIAACELRAGSHVQKRLDALDRLAATWPKGTRVAVIDPEADVGGIPTLYFTVAFASRPPFRREPIDTVWWPRVETLHRLDVWRDHEGPVTAVHVVDDAFVPVMPVLPAAADERTDSRRDGRTLTFAAPRSGRRLDAIFLKGVHPSREKVDVVATWDGPDGRVVTRTSYLGGVSGTPVAVPAPDIPGARWTSVAVDGPIDLEGAWTVGRYPIIEVGVPAEGAVRKAWPPEAMTFRGAKDANGFRFVVEMLFDDDVTRPKLVLKATPDRLAAEADGWRRFDPARATDILVEGMDGGAEALVPLLEKRMAASGARRVRAALRVEAIDWWTGMVVARSTWRPFALTDASPSR